MGVSVEEIKKRVNSLAENNPMLGHRGCRLGITFPEITAMQTRAILGAACELKKEGYNPCPEIMVPLIGTVQELKQQKSIILATSKEVFAEYGVEVEFEIGTMIEIPRAALTAGQIAEEAQYFSFGTNDLTHSRFSTRRVLVSSSRWLLRMVVLPVLTSAQVSVVSTVVSLHQLSSALRSV